MLGIIAALPDEARCLGLRVNRRQTRYRIGKTTQVRISGMGVAKAGNTAEQLIADGADALVSWGIAGALQSSLHPGTVVLPIRVTDTLGHTCAVSAIWREQLWRLLAGNVDLSLSGGILLTNMAPVTRIAEKQRLARTSQAVAVDMESAAIAVAAATAGLPFIAIRSIADAADMALPSTALSFIDGDGHLHPRRGLAHWACHPQQTSALLRLARATQRAQRSLRFVAALAGSDLSAPEIPTANQQVRVSCPYRNP